ncbi:beta-propeller fold lactonase family protein [Streptomyces anulatus]|uniref:YVTN family beta-propeller repeat protein n=1 Tax=Streptomyces anulatus TaxID=1892 RepID=UPI001C5E88FF|nr:beta-propeller fold lactonase family protein [Streptomyces anulatus]QYA98329.1 beta-propeller fold lactonase family protein [Streptomyces anulatus]
MRNRARTVHGNRRGHRAAAWTGALSLAVSSLTGLSAAGAQAAPAVKADPRHPTAYVSTINTQQVLAIDTVTGEVVDTIQLDVEAGELALSPDGSRVYVAGMYTGRVGVIDTATNTATSFAVGGQAAAIDITPDGRHAYVGDDSGPRLKVVDLATQQVTTTIATFSGVHGVDINPAGTTLYATQTTARGLQAVSTATNTVIGNIGTGGTPRSAAFTPDGSRAYVPSGRDQGSVTVLDAATHTVLTNVSTGSDARAAAVTDDGAHAWVANSGTDDIAVLDTATNTVTATVPAGDGPVDIDFTPDGKHAWVPNVSGRTISVLDTSTRAITRTVSLSAQPSYVVIAPARPAADLQVQLAAAPRPGLSGRIEYTLTVTNHGPSTADSGTVTTTFTPSGVRPTSTGCTTAPGTATCTITDLAPGASVTRTFSLPVAALSLGTPYQATATRTDSTPTDPETGNDTSSRTCTATTPLVINCN